MSERVILQNDDQMFSLAEDDQENLVLSVICGGMATYEVVIPLTKDEVSSYHQEGKAFLERLVATIQRNPDSFHR